MNHLSIEWPHGQDLRLLIFRDKQPGQAIPVEIIGQSPLKIRLDEHHKIVSFDTIVKKEESEESDDTMDISAKLESDEANQTIDLTSDTDGDDGDDGDDDDDDDDGDDDDDDADGPRGDLVIVSQMEIW
jgi:hypothetical protein